MTYMEPWKERWEFVETVAENLLKLMKDIEPHVQKSCEPHAGSQETKNKSNMFKDRPPA